MYVTSASIYHFTNNITGLKGIIRDRFKFKCSKEHVILDDDRQSKYVGVLSFCDIPLGQANEQMKKYGYYGMGTTKEWAIKIGLNPVNYFESTSNLAKNAAIFLDRL